MNSIDAAATDRITVDVNLPPGGPLSGMAADVRAGLTSPFKELSPRYFYDEYGSQLFEEAVRTLAPLGRIVVCGASSGPFAQLDLVDLFARQISVIGSSDGSRRELLEVFRLVAEGVVSPVIDQILPLERAREAQELLAGRLHFGRILLSPLLS